MAVRSPRHWSRTDILAMTDYFAGDPRTHRERMLTGDYYRDGDPENRALAQRQRVLLERYRLEFINGQQVAAEATLREVIGTMGKNVTVVPPLYLDYGGQLHLGDDVYINMGLTALDVVDITIGDGSLLGPNVQLLAATHPIAAIPRRDGIEKGLPIHIGSNVWIGGGAIICPGVSIGDDTVIGAGSVVTKDIPAGVVAYGNPARVARKITETGI